MEPPASKAYFRTFYKGNRSRFLLSIGLLLLTVPQSLVLSWLLGEVLDVIATGQLTLLGQLCLLALGLIVASVVLDLAMYRIRADFICRALAQYKSFAFQKLSEKSISAFARENTGSYLSALTNDVSSIEENYLNRTFILIMHCALFVGALGMMLWYSPTMTALAVGLSAVSIAASIAMGGQLARRERTVSDENERFVARIQDLLSGFSVIKSFKAEGEAQALFDRANETVERIKLRRRWWEALLAVVNGDVCGLLLQLGIFLVGAYLAIRGRLTAGTVIIMTQLCNYLVQPVQIVPQYWASRTAAKTLVEKLAALSAENTGRTGRMIPAALERGITLHHVTFGYEPRTPVLKDLSFTLEPGKKYALVGASGAGKSTILNLLMGAYDSYDGSITVDGTELRDIDPNSLYDLMSLIGQTVFLFDDTIRQNITMFRAFPPEQVEMAVRRSGLEPLVQQRGAEYRCGENGVNLSGGERQRISIARCLLRGTPVVLLDEATAALDNQTAFAVTDAILHLDGLTRVVVTHRLDAALLEQYDEIIVLRDGTVQEQGQFAELMEKKGYFYSLYTVTTN